MKNKIKIISLMLCMVMIGVSLATVVSAAPDIAGTDKVSENIYVEGVDTGVTFTQYKGKTYGASTDNIINVVEVDPSNTNVKLQVFNAKDKLATQNTMGTMATKYNENNDGTVIAAINGDPWFLYHNDYDEDGDRDTGVKGKMTALCRSMMIIDGEIWCTSQLSQENNLDCSSAHGAAASAQPVFGVLEDGTYMIGKPTVGVYIKNTEDGKEYMADGINRLSCKNTTIVYNYRIGDESLAYSDAAEIYLKPAEGYDSSMRMGQTVKAEVVAVYRNGSEEERPAIDENTIVISGRGNKVSQWNSFATVGDIVELTPMCTRDSYKSEQTIKWENVTQAIGGFFTQIENGVATGQPTNSDQYPCPMIGLTEDGKAMLISVSSQSEGTRGAVQMKQLSQLCKDLGLDTAIMFDGGGSNQMITIEDGAYIRRSSSSEGANKLRVVVNGIGVVYTGADLTVTNNELGSRLEIDGIANDKPSVEPDENADITGFPISAFKYAANIDFVNGAGTDESNTPYGIGTFKNAAGTHSIGVISSGISTDINGKLSITGWALVNGGQNKYYWSVDNYNWYECTGGQYDVDMSNIEDIKTAATALAGLNAISDTNAKYTDIGADLKDYVGQTVTVYFGVEPSAESHLGSVLPLVTIQNVEVQVHQCVPGDAATCTKDQVCTVCGAVMAEALGHDYVNHEAKAPTCTEVGFEAYTTCSRCDYTTYVEIAALGHTPAQAVEENRVEADCTKAGSYDSVVYCSVCGEEISREGKVIDALGHDEVNHEAKAPTCTEAGWEAYVTCSRCDYTTYAEIAATGHVYDDEQDAECNICGEKQEVEKPVEPTEEATEAPTEAPTQAPTEAPTETPATEEKSGCGSVLGVSAFAIIASISLAGCSVLKKKKD